MTTTTTDEPAYHYRAQTDKAAKAWHLGAAERDNLCFCGARLLVADDPRKVAAKIPADERQFETSDDLTLVSCGACRRNREWARASAPTAAGRERKPRQSRASRGATKAASDAAKAEAGK